ncbi:light-harvesting complex-like protein 3 isotype 1, chloroplastic [Impatiens glandulifera]|uniref:light-harvesting complex-like protein 3 isotype 1, chloroplastic n=1 Tax=Impatiens glandulifera TaxID=253017 RepID=UPI001FB0B438|nr:light-harvesting complex-like protein 3 isotype 1, chloroplastic [Impatiens glandulifera]
MAFIAANTSLPRACATNHLTEKQKKPTSQTGYSNNSSIGNKKAVQFVSLDIEGYEKTQIGGRTEDSAVKFSDERWKKGTWDLNMFVKNGRMDWDGVIVAEAKRRKFLEKFPDASSIEEPVIFRSSIIPWWAWINHSHLPEAELLNGRAAMVGFFMAYLIDVMTGLDLVGQTGNIMCKGGLFLTVLGVILFRRQGDFENLKKLTDEATFYDKQWRASWEDQEPGQR